jgi:hypothetical protein
LILPSVATSFSQPRFSDSTIKVLDLFWRILDAQHPQISLKLKPLGPLFFGWSLLDAILLRVKRRDDDRSGMTGYHQDVYLMLNDENWMDEVQGLSLLHYLAIEEAISQFWNHFALIE